MDSKQNQSRVFGQRSIASSFFFGSSSPAKSSKDTQSKDSGKSSSVSLADFLDSKLRKSPILLKSVKGKSNPFASPLGRRSDDGGCNQLQTGIKRAKEERNNSLDKYLFEQFKRNDAENGDCTVNQCGEGGKGSFSTSNSGGSCHLGAAEASSVNDKQEARKISSFEGDDKEGFPSTSVGVGSCHVASNLNELQGTRKRRKPFVGNGEERSDPKRSVVIGGNPEGKQKGQERFTRNKKPKPLYNHYANGSGWWDDDMEGVDTEEVGIGDVWEGVGTATFGVIDWH